MAFERLPFDAPLSAYEGQAQALHEGRLGGDHEALEVYHSHHSRFLDTEAKWKPLDMSPGEIQAAPLDLGDARYALARWYGLYDWASLVLYAASVAEPGSPVHVFESAVEAVVTGDVKTLKSLLADHPDLVHARSTRIAGFLRPEPHRATLLHYIGANGVEGHRQKTPPNAVEVARTLLEAGAEPDSLADLYEGKCTTMTMLVSSCHPANAGLQAALVHVLVDHGASVERTGEGNWTSPLMTALAFGYRPAAEALVERGATIPTLPAAAGVGSVDEARRLLPMADGESRHRALALAAQMGHVDVVALLLDAGEDPNRFNPEGLHSHSTPLHQAALAGHLDVVRLLVERGASFRIKDKLWDGTALGWAIHGHRETVEQYLRSQGAGTHW